MIVDSKLSEAMNAEIAKIAEEIGSEDKMQTILEKYNLFKQGALAMWSLDEDEKQVLIRLMETEIALTESEKKRISDENKKLDERIENIVNRAESGGSLDGIERLTKEAYEREMKKEKKGVFSRLFGKKE